MTQVFTLLKNKNLSFVGIDFAYVAKAMEMNAKQLAAMERDFLSAVKFDLYLTQNDVEDWTRMGIPISPLRSIMAAP